MTSSLNQFLNGKFSNLKQIGPKSWLLCDENGKTYVLNRFMAKNQKAEDSFKINDILFKNPNNNFKNNFLFYEHRGFIDEFSFILVEYCREGDLNKYLIENRYKKQDNDEQIKNWILQLLRAIEFLNRNRIVHKKLCTYTIFVHNGQLKIDGFEYAQKVLDDNSTLEISLSDNYGIFNSPEIVKCKKINFKYHVWCIGWIIYEICTCEWKHFSLLNQNFDDWKAPSLPDNYSKSLNNLFKKMVKLSPTSRSKPERLIKIANEFFSRDKLIRKKSEEISESLNFRDYLLKAFDQRFEKDFESRDQDEHLSDSDEENNCSKSDIDLDVSEKFKNKNKIFKGKLNDYKVKQIVQSSEYFLDYLTINKNKKRRMLRIIKYNNNSDLKKDLTYVRDIHKRIKDFKNPFIALNDEFFDLSHKLCFSTEFFEEGTLAEFIRKFGNESRTISEEKIFDFVFYLINGVCFLHENRITHRDIRPAFVNINQSKFKLNFYFLRNIYLRNERLKIGNFGLDFVLQNEILQIEDKNREQMPCYFSPEIIISLRPDNRCDIWSIGCVLYEMFRLEHLFINKDLKHIISNCQFPRPEINCRKKIQNLFLSLIKPVNERPTSNEVLRRIDEMIRKERETYENPRSCLDSD